MLRKQSGPPFLMVSAIKVTPLFDLEVIKPTESRTQASDSVQDHTQGFLVQ